MGKNGYLQRQRNTVNVYRQAEKETYIQFMTDTLILTLNDPAVMGKDVFGEKRMPRGGGVGQGLRQVPRRSGEG